MADDAATIEVLDADAAQTAVPALADVLIDCVHGGASVSFMAPLSREKAEAFWSRMVENAARGDTRIIVARVDGVVLGTVLVHLATP